LNKYGLSALLFFLVLTSLGCVSRQGTPTPLPTGNLQITVADINNNLLEGAKVVSGTQPGGQAKVTGITGAAGEVIFDNIKAGDYIFQVSRFDYEPVEIQTTVVGARTTNITIKLTKSTAAPG
jgi:hypothetical protein